MAQGLIETQTYVIPHPMVPADPNPPFRSGLRRLLYPAIHRTDPADDRNPDQLAALLRRIDLQPADCQALPPERRTLAGRSVDVATGEALIHANDFELMGSVPFQWSRRWRSGQLAAGSLGTGWRHAYDLVLLEDRPSYTVVIRLAGNRGVLFPLLAAGESFWHRAEKLRLDRDERGYRLQGSDGVIYCFADQPAGSICRLTALESIDTTDRIQLTYTPEGQLRRISDDYQRALTVTSSPEGRILRMEATLPDQMTVPLVAYRYDEVGNLTEVTVHRQRTAQYVYRRHRIIRLLDALGRSTFLQYEAVGKQPSCQEIRLEDGTVSLRFDYLTAEGITRVTSADGGVRQYVHEGGRVQRYIQAGGQQRVWFFNTFGERVSEQDELGNTSFFTYDDEGQLIQATWPDGGKMTMEYNASGQLTAMTDRAGGGWQWQYDTTGRLLACIHPDETETRFTYGPKGWLNEKTVSDGSWVRWEHDSYGNRKNQLDSTGRRTDHPEDSPASVYFFDQISQKVPANEQRVSPKDSLQPTLDANGRLIRLRKEPRLNWQFIRDAAGRVREYTRPDGQSTRFYYDAAGRLTEVLTDDGNWHQYTYRPDGLLIEAATPTSRLQLERDLRGRIGSETSGTDQVKSVYDLAGRRILRQSTESEPVQYNYGESGRLTGLQQGFWQVRILHDRLGRLAECQFPGGLRSRWQYNTGRLPTSLQLFSGTGLHAFRSQTYGWNAHQLSSIHDDRFGQVTLRYDRFNAPIEAVCSTGWTERWVAERMAYQRQLLKPALDSMEPGWQLVGVGGFRFYYDAEGYLREKHSSDGQQWLYQWDPSGTLQAVTRPNGPSVVFTYDALGRRIRKQLGERSVDWTWDLDRLLGERHYQPGSDPVSLSWFPAGQLGALLVRVNETPYSVIGNVIGQPLSFHQASGEPVWEWDWCLFGKKRKLIGPPRVHTFLGTGQYEDPEVGLVYANFRYYDGQTGLPLNPEYSSPAGWWRAGWAIPHAPESYLSAARCIRVY